MIWPSEKIYVLFRIKYIYILRGFNTFWEELSNVDLFEYPSTSWYKLSEKCEKLTPPSACSRSQNLSRVSECSRMLQIISCYFILGGFSNYILADRNFTWNELEFLAQQITISFIDKVLTKSNFATSSQLKSAIVVERAFPLFALFPITPIFLGAIRG